MRRHTKKKVSIDRSPAIFRDTRKSHCQNKLLNIKSIPLEKVADNLNPPVSSNQNSEVVSGVQNTTSHWDSRGILNKISQWKRDLLIENPLGLQAACMESVPTISVRRTQRLKELNQMVKANVYMTIWKERARKASRARLLLGEPGPHPGPGEMVARRAGATPGAGRDGC